MFKAKIRTTKQRRQAGRALRRKCSRRSHGKQIHGHGSERDIVALIEASNEDRIETLVPIRHGRMLQSEFAFFRGTAALQAHDLAGTPTSGIEVQACGDCHLMNFGGFATPERNLVFDINDFDETLSAPFEWDLKRLAASCVIAARWRGFKADEAREIAVAAVASYRTSMAERAGTSVLEAWYSKIDMDDVRKLAGKVEDIHRRLDKKIAEAYKRTHEGVANAITVPSRGLSRIVDQPPLLFHDPSVTEDVAKRFLAEYRSTLADERRILFDRFQPVDAAVKVVGVGSVGTRCLVVLLLASADDPLFLQVKEARRSVLEPYVRHAKIEHNGQRIVVGQRLMQSSSDIFLGWSKGSAGREFYVRQLRDMKIAPDIASHTPEVMHAYATLCGMALARAHDKAGDAAVIAGYLGSSDKFDRAVGDYAVAYADQVERDYATFATAVRAGRLRTDLSGSELEEMLR